MAGIRQAFARLHVGRLRPLIHLSVAGIGLAGGAAGPALAGADITCAAAGQGGLNVELDARGPATRQVVLRAGDTLTFTFQAAAGPRGSVMLVQAGRSPRLLLAGPSGTSVAFAAAARGAFEFQFAQDGMATAAFAASCKAAGTARLGKTAASRRGLGSLPSTMSFEDGAEIEAPALELDVAQPPAAAPSGSGQPGTAAVPKATGGSEVKLQWREQRLRSGGPEGPEIDGNGVDIGLNFKLKLDIMVGALAQFDPSVEAPVGAPRSLLDQGWMAGPMTTVKLAPGLLLDAKAAWGVTERAADDFATKSSSAPRRMVSARLANTQSFGAWRLTPSVSVNHVQEGAVPMPVPHEAAVPYATGFGRVDAGPELAYRIDLDRSVFVEPKAAIGSFWSFDTSSKLAPGVAAHAEPRLKAEAGVTVGVTDGSRLQATGGVEEGEVGTPNVWSGRLQFSVPMK